MFTSLRPSERLVGAATDNNLDELRLAIADGADVNFRRTKNTPLLLALQRGHKEAAQILVDAGADINMGNGFDWYPIHEVAQRGWMDWVEVIASDSMNSIDRRDSSGLSPLAVAIAASHEDVALYLVSQKCNVNAPNEQGVTPLMQAVERQSASLLSAMMNHRPDPYLKDKSGRSAFDRAENWPAGLGLFGPRQVEETASIASDMPSEAAPEVAQTGVAGIQKRRRPSPAP